MAHGLRPGGGSTPQDNKAGKRPANTECQLGLRSVSHSANRHRHGNRAIPPTLEGVVPS